MKRDEKDEKEILIKSTTHCVSLTFPDNIYYIKMDIICYAQNAAMQMFA